MPDVAARTRPRLGPLLALLAASLAATVPGAAGAEESPVARVPFEKYVLPNGMTVILHPDPSLPLAAVNLWVKVGAKDEPPHRSGFAHLFEHLMFMGTERVPQGEFDRIMEGAGGANNAGTSLDYTQYYASGPARLLPTLLWLEADRLEALPAAMTPEKVALQRDVVLNEKKQSYDNSPYGLSELVLYETMYPEGHPYRYDVIGRDEDIRSATVEDVRRFFATYYVPGNVSLAIGGRFDPEVVKPLVARLFGTLETGREPPRGEAPAPRLPGVVRRTLRDDVSLARTTLVWHSPPIYGPGDAEMDLLAGLLADGKDSRLYRRLVHGDQTAVDVSAWQESGILGSLFRVSVSARPGADLDAIERAVDEELVRLREEGPAEAEVARGRVRLETSVVESLQSLPARIDRLNNYEFHFGDPDGLGRDLERYRRVTAASVREWTAKVLDPDRHLILRVLPRGEEGEPGTAGPRDERPADLPEPAFEPPVPEAFTLPNGLAVWHLDRPGLPLVALQLVLPWGSVADGPGRAGLASLTAALLDEGAGDRDALAFAAALEGLGTSLALAADRESLTAGLHVLRSRLEPAVGLLADAVARPRLEAADFERVKAIRLADLARRDDDPEALARRLALERYFGAAHPYGPSPDGVPATVEGLRLEDVREFHRARVRPEGAVLLVAGDVRRKDLEALLVPTLGAWRGTGAPAPAADVPPVEPPALRVFLADRPGAEQTAVRWVMPGPCRGEGADRVRLDLANLPFGGGFSSRINQNLRETHGWTYGAYSSSEPWRRAGTFQIGTAVTTEATGAALAELAKEVERFHAGDLSEEEAAKGRSTWRNGLVASFETLEGMVGQYAVAALHGEGRDRLAADAAVAEAAGLEDLAAVARRLLHPGRGVLLLVGDRAAILRQWEGLALPRPEILPPER